MPSRGGAAYRVPGSSAYWHLQGGFGSGQPSGSARDKVEYSRSIEVNKLHKAGCLDPGWTRGWQ